MLVKEINRMLKDKSMANKNTNLKIIDGDKTPRLTLTKFYKEFKEYTKQQEENWKNQQKFNNEVKNFMVNQQKFNQEMLDFQKLVIKQFKKHGWLD